MKVSFTQTAIQEKDIVLTPRSSRHNHTPLLQRRPLRQIRNQIRTVKQQIRNALFLPHLPINDGAKLQLFRICYLRSGNQTRSQRCVCVEALGESPLRDTAGECGISLQFSRRDVVADCVCGDVIEGGFGGNVFGVFADYEALMLLISHIYDVKGEGKVTNSPS